MIILSVLNNELAHTPKMDFFFFRILGFLENPRFGFFGFHKMFTNVAPSYFFTRYKQLKPHTFSFGSLTGAGNPENLHTYHIEK